MSRNHITTLVAVTVLFALIIAGCSGSGATNPAAITSPDTVSQNPMTQTIPDASKAYNLWGYWWVSVDINNNTWEIVPDRGVMMHFNVRELLEDGMPCSDCISILSILDNGDGTADIAIRLRHPLPQESFTGFDVRSICCWKGSELWPDSGLRTQDPDGTDGYILNPDGYTTLFNPNQFPPGSDISLFTYSKGLFATPDFPDSTLNPFLEYMTDTERHMYRSGQTVTRTWVVRYPTDGTFVMGYAVAACWEPPNPDPPQDIPGDFSLQANQPEPYDVEVLQPVLLNPYMGSTATIEVDVWDWQGDSEGAWIECPELWTGRKYSESEIAETDYVRYFLTVQNETGMTDGAYRALVGAMDVTPASYPYDYTMYTFYDIGVGIPPPNEPPVAAAEADQYSVYMGEEVVFNSLSWDPDGVDDIVDWRWDIDNDGGWDLSGESVVWTYDTAGVYQVDHMVTDQGSLSDDLEPDELLMIVVDDPCCNTPPVAAIEGEIPDILTNQQVTLTNESYDPDGDFCTVNVAWDLDGDGNYNDAFGNQVTLSWSQPGTYHISLLATDSCGLQTSTYSDDIEAHPGVTINEDMGYKNVGTRYNYISADMFPLAASALVDVSNPNGPWNFTPLPLLNVGNHSAVLPPTQAECLPFKDDFTQPYDHFYKHAISHLTAWDQVYIAENYVTSPDRLLWVGGHEHQYIGSVNCYPSLEFPFPLWVFTDYDYTVGFPPIFGLDITVDGYGEGLITVPWGLGIPQPCTVVKVKTNLESYLLDAQAIAYMFYLDTGYLVAIVGTYNSGAVQNFDWDTDVITGQASYNALFSVVPY